MQRIVYSFTCDASPVQAEGTILGHRFYFRSRFEHWTFSVSESPEIDPVDIQLPEHGDAYGFYVEGTYGEKPFDASYMPLEEAKRIIEECAQLYIARHDQIIPTVES